MTPPVKIHSVYADGAVVVDGQEPPRIVGPDPLAIGCPHTVLRWDRINGRVYQAREYDAQGRPVRDVDLTNPTFPDGRMRVGHPGPPHQHRWVPVDLNNPAAGFRRGVAETIP